LKSEYKKIILKTIMKKEEVNAVEMIKLAIASVNDEKTKNCVRNGFECINE
jgi:hypothetical protein